MEFKKLQQGVLERIKEYSKEYNVQIDEEFALLKLAEEVGEFYQAVLIHRKKCRPEKFVSEKESRKFVSKELADIFANITLNADFLGIDLEQAIKEKSINKEWLKEQE